MVHPWTAVLSQRIRVNSPRSREPRRSSSPRWRFARDLIVSPANSIASYTPLRKEEKQKIKSVLWSATIPVASGIWTARCAVIAQARGHRSAISLPRKFFSGSVTVPVARVGVPPARFHLRNKKSPAMAMTIPTILCHEMGSLKNKTPATAIKAAPPARIIGTADSGPPF